MEVHVFRRYEYLRGIYLHEHFLTIFLNYKNIFFWLAKTSSQFVFTDSQQLFRPLKPY